MFRVIFYVYSMITVVACLPFCFLQSRGKWDKMHSPLLFHMIPYVTQNPHMYEELGVNQALVIS